MAAPIPREAPVMRIWVFIHAAFHSVDKNSTKVIERGYQQIGSHLPKAIKTYRPTHHTRLQVT
jgi:hypothetical protein